MSLRARSCRKKKKIKNQKSVIAYYFTAFIILVRFTRMVCPRVHKYIYTLNTEGERERKHLNKQFYVRRKKLKKINYSKSYYTKCRAGSLSRRSARILCKRYYYISFFPRIIYQNGIKKIIKYQMR